MPKVYNKRHKNIPKDAVYVGRPSAWGNPWSHVPGIRGTDLVGSREQAVNYYRESMYNRHEEIQASLRGKDLVCWCAPKSCHADVLLEIANAST